MIALTALALCAAVDGDGLRCGPERIRLAGVNARELHGHPCPNARPCPTMIGPAAKALLARLIAPGVTIQRRERDRYGRTVADVTLADGRDLACVLTRAGAVARWNRYWPKGKRCGR